MIDRWSGPIAATRLQFCCTQEIVVVAAVFPRHSVKTEAETVHYILSLSQQTLHFEWFRVNALGNLIFFATEVHRQSHKSFLMHAENKCPKWMTKFWGEIYLMNLCPHYVLYELNPLYFHLNKYIQKSKQIFSFAVGLLSIQKQMWIL